MIEDPSQFFGRERELRRIFSRVAAGRPQCVSVVGERRIGKSSLLRSLTWERTQSSYCSGESPTFLYFDLQGHPGLDSSGFMETIGTQIQQWMPEAEESGTGLSHYTQFLALVRKFCNGGRCLVLLFDEFDVVTRSRNFPADFYSFLRSAANNLPIAYVTSSNVELQRICHSSEVADSPFFNIFSNLYLRCFDETEASELIRVPSAREGLPLEPYADQISRLAGRFPFYLQIACSVYFEAMEESADLDASQPELLERFLEEASPHYRYYWEHADEQARLCLDTLTRSNQLPVELSHVARKLARDGYLVSLGSSRYQLASEGLEEFLRRQRVASNSSGDVELLTWETSLSSRESINQYKLLHRAGEGGMGVVFEAEDTMLNRKVALKVCHPNLQGNESLRKRILSEARLAASLDHPSITSIYELFVHQGQLVLIMEWIEGRTLAELIASEGPIEWRLLVGWMVQACDGLEAAHRQGIVHRDIKPANLMLSSQERLKITDFGLAKCWIEESTLRTELTLPGAILGSLQYMSPEQAAGKPVSHHSDLFSLGVVIFEALTGRLPFKRKTVPETLNAIVNEPAPFLGLYGVEEAAKIDPILKKLLAKSIEERYSSAQAVRKDLEKLLKEPRIFPWFKDYWK